MSESELTTETLPTGLVPGPVDVAVLRPPDYAESQERYPLLLLLHGGGGSSEFLTQLRPVIEAAWDSGRLPHVVVATPSAGRSFYMNYRDGSQRWESFLLDELIPELRRRWRVEPERESTWLSGISMGGMGSLRLALKYPERFAAVAALEPGIEPALSFAEIRPRDRIYRERGVYEEKFGSPVDEAWWQANNPANVARANARAIVESGLTLYLECGDEDAFYLQHGAEFLHRVLFDGGIPHEYRLVRGGDHIGPSLPGRVLDALAFLGRTRRPDESLEAPGPMSLEAFHQMVDAMRRSAGYAHVETRLVKAGDAVIHATERGAPENGEPVVLLPSLGRGAVDFDDLANRLALAGHRVITPEPRGIGGSSGRLEELTLHDLARDVARVIEACGGRPVSVVGHAFGNRVARTLASDCPDLVRRVALLAAGGRTAVPPEVQLALIASFNPLQPLAQRLASIQLAFFASGNDPAVWLDGWHPHLAAAQLAAGAATPTDEWWGAGNAAILVVQALEDTVAPPENARLLAQDYGPRVRVAELPNAGHAMLPEQPEAIAKLLIDWLGEGG
jgi:S-formylglutathione hydrolase